MCRKCTEQRQCARRATPPKAQDPLAPTGAPALLTVEGHRRQRHRRNQTKHKRGGGGGAQGVFDLVASGLRSHGIVAVLHVSGIDGRLPEARGGRRARRAGGQVGRRASAAAEHLPVSGSHHLRLRLS